ncbi:hypothetical protein [Candidatus Nitrosocosmicus oleophilus]
MLCQLYGSFSPNATLIGIKYMIDFKMYQTSHYPTEKSPN